MNITEELKDTCGSGDIVCKNQETGQLWPDDFLDPATGNPGHCKGCGLACAAADEPASSVSAGVLSAAVAAPWMCIAFLLFGDIIASFRLFL